MSHHDKEYGIGIDLGTTHCALAYGKGPTRDPSRPDEEGRATLEVLDIPQAISPGNVGERKLLPSFLYIPGAHEMAPQAATLPWQENPPVIAGELARRQGTSVPHRMVASAKSWLCHGGVDRRSPLLPWGGSPDDVERMSPLQASTHYLSHLVAAWHNKMDGPEQAAASSPLGGSLQSQAILTVPASFDAVARELTVEAARSAGLERPVLLEEPQAALYSWLEHRGEAWRKDLSVGDVVLVCDVGGGTTDLSLIAITQEDGNLVPKRVAVGDHILLGGDNMDMTLAYKVRNQLQKDRGVKLDNWQFCALIQGCRIAKEALLSNPAAHAHPVVIPGRGSRLVGGAIRTELTREEVSLGIVEGFFPMCRSNDTPHQNVAMGLAELGLPYASDPSVSRHLARFLTRHKNALDDLPGEWTSRDRSFLHPTALLFNGGVFKATPLMERLVGILNGWLASDGGRAVKVLDNPCLDLAVARGAAYYALVRQGSGIRIRGGTARSYYVGVRQAMPAIPGFEPPMAAVCLAPFGMEEGSEEDLPGREFGLVVGQPAQFHLLASSVRRQDRPGTVITDWEEGELEELPPLETTLEPPPSLAAAAHNGDANTDNAHDHGAADDRWGKEGELIPVGLRAAVTEVGTLVLSCVEKSGATPLPVTTTSTSTSATATATTSRQWKLEFNVREHRNE